MNFPTRYLPKTLVSRDKQRQYNMLVKSKTQYITHGSVYHPSNRKHPNTYCVPVPYIM